MQLSLPQPLLQTVISLAQAFDQAGGITYVVGGAVREGLLHQEASDADLEVFGLQPAHIESLLQAQGYRYDAVGKAFGVFKLKDHPIDISVPRREVRSGTGHRGFSVQPDPYLPLPAAAQRRDFTFNALYYNPLSQQLFDFFGGAKDLACRRLRHIGYAFGEDPLRVLRAMQLIARLELYVEPSTLMACQAMQPQGLPPERLMGEWAKCLTLGQRPSMGLQFLADCGWLRHYPELVALQGCPQDPRWHPEGDVWMHTLHSLDAFARRRSQALPFGEDAVPVQANSSLPACPAAQRDSAPDHQDGTPATSHEALIVGLAVLCHDIGKPLCTQVTPQGHICSPGHDVLGVGPCLSFLARLTQQTALTQAVATLVKAHMRPSELFKVQASDSAVRRLCLAVQGKLERLVRLAWADTEGRPPFHTQPFEAGQWLMQRARALALADSTPKPLMLGRHLIALGLRPGSSFTHVLQHCFQAQLDGAFSTVPEGLAFLKAYLQTHSGLHQDLTEPSIQASIKL